MPSVIGLYVNISSRLLEDCIFNSFGGEDTLLVVHLSAVLSKRELIELKQKVIKFILAWFIDPCTM